MRTMGYFDSHELSPFIGNLTKANDQPKAKPSSSPLLFARVRIRNGKLPIVILYERVPSPGLKKSVTRNIMLTVNLQIF